MREHKDWFKTRPYPTVTKLEGKALEMRKKCLTKPIECDTIKKKMKERS